MWLSKWKWVVACCAALVLTGGGTVAALWRDTPEPPAPPTAKPEFVLVPAAPAPEPPKPAPAPKKEEPKPAWDVARDYLQLIIDDKPEQAKKLGDDLKDRYVKEIQVAGLKRVKLVTILVNDSRAFVVTERAKLKRRPDADPTDDHVIVTLERRDATSPWRVIENDVADEKKVLREVGDYLAGKYDFKPDEKKKNKEDEKEPKTDWGVATEFLKLALSDKPADALKLVVPGTVSENKIGELKTEGIIGTKPMAILLNDGRIEVAFERSILEQDEIRPDHLVLMLARKGDGPWQVKDIDFRFKSEVADRVKLYLGGRYDTPPKK